MLRLKPRNGIYYMQGTVRCLDGSSVPVRRSTGIPVGNKVEAFAYMQREATNIIRAGESYLGHVEKETVNDGVAAYLARPGEVGQTDRLIVCKFRESFRHRTMAGLLRKEVSDWVHSGKVAASTIARRINTINALFSFCAERGMSVPDFRLKRPSYDDSRVRWITAAERDLLLSHLDGRARDLATFLFHTGCRQGEAYKLKYRDLSEDSVVFNSRKGKGSVTRRRSVPLNTCATNAVGTMGPPDEYVFQTPSGTRWNRATFGREFRAACLAAGIDDFRIHDARHTFASMLVQGGVSLRTIAEMLGHKSMTTVARYAHLSPAVLHSAVSLLEDGGKPAQKLAHI